MNEAQINYIGPAPKALTHDKTPLPRWRRIPLAFLVAVVLPTMLAAVYFLLIASPRYVSEAHFIVRTPNQSQPSSLGVALQGVGLASGQSDTFAVHEYISSRDGLRDLSKTQDVASILNPRGADILSGWPRPWESRTEEGLYKGLQRFVTVGYDSATGISVLRVEAFRAQDARNVAVALLGGGENLVNRLNDRASRDAIAEAVVARDMARQRLEDAQRQLVAFRNQEQFIDPARAAAESSQLVGNLMANVATLKAERAQLAAEAPSSPQLPVIDSRIAAYERQIVAERAKIAGDAGSIAPKISTYENLMMNREFADKELAAATASLVSAEQYARRQKLYLDQIVSPSLPDKPSEPRRWIAVLSVFASCMLAYGVGWLLWAGVREHRQD